MKANLKNYRQSPRKVRLVANLVRGKGVNRALAELRFTPKRASAVLGKLISSDVANAKNKDRKESDTLYIKNIEVNEGRTLHRSMPMSKGRAFRIRKRSSHISLSLAEKVKGKEKGEGGKATTKK